MGRYEAVIAAGDGTVTAIERRGDLFILQELLRVRGSILMSAQAAEPAEAEQCFQSALDLAAHQRALAWELRAATNLARLRLDRGHRDEARKVLDPVYDRFAAVRIW
jgi:predicted ATPase